METAPARIDPTYLICRCLLLSELDLTRPDDSLVASIEQGVRGRLRSDEQISSTDLTLWIRRILKEIADRDGVDRWEKTYNLLLDHMALEVDWDGDMPVIPTAKIQTWLKLLDDFDESSLLCQDLVQRRRRPMGAPPAVPENWGLVTRVGDFDLDRLLARTATDLHVHLGGMRQPAVAWARAMASQEGWRAFDGLAEVFKEIHLDWEEVATEAFKNRERLCSALRDNAQMLGRAPDESVAAYAIGMRKAWRDPDPLRFVMSERRLLVAAHWALRLTAYSSSSPEDIDRMAKPLWAYIRARHHFQRCTRQPAFADSPGLERFDRRFFRAVQHRASAPAAPRTTTHLSAFRSNRGFARSEHWAAAHVLASEDCLRRVELRISPLPRVVDYFIFLKNWKEIAADVAAKGGRLPEVHFAVHFVRTNRADQRRRRNPGTDLSPIDPGARWAEFHGDIGRKAAVLHRALTDPDHLDLTAMIKRIDVAGRERDTPIELFAPHLRLLRGDEGALQALEDLEFGVRHSESTRTPPHVRDVYRYSREWREMARTGRHRVRYGRQLALTVHAGEDYADPLAGLFQIWAAIELCGMKSGEAIGHALALVAPPAFGSSPMITPLQNWASLAWLRWVLTQRNDMKRLGSPEGQLLDRLLRRKIPIASGEFADDSGAMFDEMYRDVRPDQPGSYQKRLPSLSEAFWKAMGGPNVAITLAEREALFPLVSAAQEWLLQLIIDKRIVIEGNPSSNLRISGARSLADLATVRLLEKVNNGLLLCINTDNPGTFAASIRNEYALLLQGAMDRDPEDKAARIRRALVEVLETGHSGIRFR